MDYECFFQPLSTILYRSIIIITIITIITIIARPPTQHAPSPIQSVRRCAQSTPHDGAGCVWTHGPELQT